MGKMRPQGHPFCIFGGGTSEEAAQAEAFTNFTRPIQHALFPEEAADIYGLPPLPPTSTSMGKRTYFK